MRRWGGKATMRRVVTQQQRRSVTHGRQSIRESLRVFARVTRHLAAAPPSDACVVRPNTSFEELCKGTGVPGTARLGGPASCGNTMECFASLFVSPHSSQMSELLDGGVLWQLAHNPNVAIYSWQVHVAAQIRALLGRPASRGGLSGALELGAAGWASLVLPRAGQAAAAAASGTRCLASGPTPRKLRPGLHRARCVVHTAAVPSPAAASCALRCPYRRRALTRQWLRRLITLASYHACSFAA
eukprot:SAG11_NODE_2503_length_3278_cov_1.735451_1_plen_243_part_00